MKVLIVGAGVIGTIYGWALTNAGHSVVHLVRPGRRSKLENGISMDVMDRRKGYKKWFVGTYAIRTVDALNATDAYEIVIVPVRHYALEEVLKQIAPLTPNADYVLLTQNWNGVAGISQHLPSSRFVFGDAKAGGSFQGDKLISTLYQIELGGVDAGAADCLRKAAQLFRSANINTNVEENILRYLWVEYALNTGSLAAIARAGSAIALAGNRLLWNASMVAVKECLAVVAARGVELKDYPLAKLMLTESRLQQVLVRLAFRLIFQLSEYVRRNTEHALADPRELHTFYYDLITTGRELGVAMPVMLEFKNDVDNFAKVLSAKN